MTRRAPAEGPSFRAVMPMLGRAPSGRGVVTVGFGGGDHSELGVGHRVPQQTRAGVFKSAPHEALGEAVRWVLESSTATQTISGMASAACSEAAGEVLEGLTATQTISGRASSA